MLFAVVLFFITNETSPISNERTLKKNTTNSIFNDIKKKQELYYPLKGFREGSDDKSPKVNKETKIMLNFLILNNYKNIVVVLKSLDLLNFKFRTISCNNLIDKNYGANIILTYSL